MNSKVREFIQYLRRAISDARGLVVGLGGSKRVDLGSQRMCPFCGLITSSRKSSCLECGKVFKPA